MGVGGQQRDEGEDVMGAGFDMMGYLSIAAGVMMRVIS